MGNKAYRLYKVTIIDNRNQPLPGNGLMQGTEPIDYLFRLLRTICNKPFLVKPYMSLPIPQTVLTPQADDPCFCVMDVQRDRTYPMLQIRMVYGRYGEKDYLIDPQGVTSPINNDAAVDTYTLRLAFTGQNNEFHIVSPMKGRRHGALYLLSYLAYADRCANEPNGQVWYKYEPTPEIDPNRLHDIKINGKPQAVTLKMKTSSAMGVQRLNPVTIRMETKTVQAKRSAKAMLLSWFSHPNKLSAQGCARDIQQAFGQDLYADPNAIWDDAGIIIEENDKSTTITAKTIDALFIYPLGTGATMHDLWTDAARKISDICRQGNIYIPDIATFQP